jgi:hypothetical protein
LRGEDPGKIYEAIRILAAAPPRALPFLRERLKPIPAVDSARIDKLVKQLGDGSYAERKKAAVELRKLGDLALPALRQANARGSYDEVTRRIQEKLESQYPTRQQLQALYGVQALERMGTAEARQFLKELAGGTRESLLTEEARTAVERLSQEADVSAEKTKLEKLWSELAGDDSQRAYRAMHVLLARPTEAAPLLRESLRSLAAAHPFDDDDPKQIPRLIADLDNDQFATRENATRRLSSLGKHAEAALRRALNDSPALEKRRRIEALLANMGRSMPLPERLQMDRAVEVLERLDTEGARRVLKELSNSENRMLKKAATEALRRLGES